MLLLTTFLEKPNSHACHFLPCDAVDCIYLCTESVKQSKAYFSNNKKNHFQFTFHFPHHCSLFGALQAKVEQVSFLYMSELYY